VRAWFENDRSVLFECGVMIATLAAVGGVWRHFDEVRSDVRAQVGAAEGRLRQLGNGAALIEQAERRKSEIADRVRFAEEIRASQSFAAELLLTVGDSVPDGLWLLELKQAGAAVEIDGRALSIAAVADFLENLQRSRMFAQPVSAASAASEQLDETVVVRFSLKAVALRAPAPAD
jgi:Tfp pilus assembly protein PilN